MEMMSTTTALILRERRPFFVLSDNDSILGGYLFRYHPTLPATIVTNVPWPDTWRALTSYTRRHADDPGSTILL